MSAKPVKDAYYGETRYYCIAHGQGNTRIPSQATLPMQHKGVRVFIRLLTDRFPSTILRPQALQKDALSILHIVPLLQLFLELRA